MVRLKVDLNIMTEQTRRCFNSTMVRLKVAQKRTQKRSYLCFNSTMVRLKGDDFYGAIGHIHEFQFHNGSIKRDRDMIMSPFPYMFQFHNGSIKSFMLNEYVYEFTQFQFHNGSIKSRRGILPRLLRRSFNSTMVRLKGDYAHRLVYV